MRQHIENPSGRLHSVQWVCSDTNMSRKTLMRVAQEAQAVVRIGRMVKIDTDKLYSYITTVYEGD